MQSRRSRGPRGTPDQRCMPRRGRRRPGTAGESRCSWIARLCSTASPPWHPPAAGCWLRRARSFTCLGRPRLIAAPRVMTLTLPEGFPQEAKRSPEKPPPSLTTRPRLRPRVGSHSSTAACCDESKQLMLTLTLTLTLTTRPRFHASTLSSTRSSALLSDGGSYLPPTTTPPLRATPTCSRASPPELPGLGVGCIVGRRSPWAAPDRYAAAMPLLGAFGWACCLGMYIVYLYLPRVIFIVPKYPPKNTTCSPSRLRCRPTTAQLHPSPSRTASQPLPPQRLRITPPSLLGLKDLSSNIFRGIGRSGGKLH